MLKFSFEEKQKIIEIIKSFSITEKGDTLKSITLKNRIKVLLFLEKDMSQKEISELFCISAPAVRDTLKKEIRKAKRFLEEELA